MGILARSRLLTCEVSWDSGDLFFASIEVDNGIVMEERKEMYPVTCEIEFRVCNRSREMLPREIFSEYTHSGQKAVLDSTCLMSSVTGKSKGEASTLRAITPRGSRPDGAL